MFPYPGSCPDTSPCMGGVKAGAKRLFPTPTPQSGRRSFHPASPKKPDRENLIRLRRAPIRRCKASLPRVGRPRHRATPGTRKPLACHPPLLIPLRQSPPGELPQRHLRDRQPSANHHSHDARSAHRPHGSTPRIPHDSPERETRCGDIPCLMCQPHASSVTSREPRQCAQERTRDRSPTLKVTT